MKKEREKAGLHAPWRAATFTGYKSKTVSDTIMEFQKWWEDKDSLVHFGHALEKFFKDVMSWRPQLTEPEYHRLRQNVIERIKLAQWIRRPKLEYYKLAGTVSANDSKEDLIYLCIEAAHCKIKNDTPLTTPVTNDNIGFL